MHENGNPPKKKLPPVYTLYHRRKPGDANDRPIFYVRIKIGAAFIRRSCQTRIRLSAEQAALAWLSHYKREIARGDLLT
jgi:hypothetical protein